jgi:hypothetical protein
MSYQRETGRVGVANVGVNMRCAREALAVGSSKMQHHYTHTNNQ